MKQAEFSPFGLIQESLYPNEFLILVSCILLNCTTRKQLETVFPTFIELYDTPEKLLAEKEENIQLLIAPLGFKNRRSKTLYRFATEYLKKGWKSAGELPGIGEYGSRAWSIFVKHELGTTVPNDGALKTYYLWRIQQDSSFPE